MRRVLLIMLLPLSVYGQNLNPAPFLAMGNTGVSQRGIYSLAKNPAGMILPSLSLATAYQNHFVGSQIQTLGLFAASPIFSSSAVGVKVISYGLPELVKFNAFGVSYVKRIGPHLSSSLTFNHHRYFVRGQVSDKAYSADLGFQWIVLESLVLGVHYRNITAAHFIEYVDQSIPQELQLGFLYNLSSDLAFSCDVSRDGISDLTQVNMGASYAPSRKVFFSGGVSTSPQQYYAGIGLVFDAFRMDLASSFHPRLGSSPQVSICYAFP